LIVEGRQFAFTLEGVWKSDFAPQSGMLVEVEMGERGNIVELRGLTEYRSDDAKPPGQTISEASQSSLHLPDGAVLGMPTLIAAGLLIAGWFALSAISLRTPIGSLDFTFWQVLGLLNSNVMPDRLLEGSSTGLNPGLYGFAGLVALAGPFFPYVWNDRKALLGGLLPLLFTLMVGMFLRRQVTVGLESAGNMAYREAIKGFSVGTGLYLASAAGIYLAVQGCRRFLAAGTQVRGQPTLRAAA
jgi:hypothetical protein